MKEVTATEAVLKDGRVIPFGVCVWSTGVGPTPFIDALGFAKTARGRLAVDRYLRVLQQEEQGFDGGLEVSLSPIQRPCPSGERVSSA